MKKLAKIEENSSLSVFVGTDIEWALSQGYTEMLIVQDFNNQWILEEDTQTPEYKRQKRLKEIELELNQAEIEYNDILNTPVLYTNNKLYKPKWSSEIYVTLLTAGQLSPERFPVSIWDASELEENMTLMSFMELSLLTNFLGDIKEIAFNTRKETRSKLLAEKRELEEN